MSAEPCSRRNHGRSKADWSAATATGDGSQLATGPAVTSGTLARGAAAKRVEKDDEEEEKRQAELRRAQDQLKKCLEDADYTGAAAAKEKISALMSAEPKFVEEKEGGRRRRSVRQSFVVPRISSRSASQMKTTREQRPRKRRLPHS